MYALVHSEEQVSYIGEVRHRIMLEGIVTAWPIMHASESLARVCVYSYTCICVVEFSEKC